MISTVGLFVLAAALQAPIEPPAPRSVLPAGCGLTEDELLVLAIPNYHERVARSKAHEHEELNDYQFSAMVTNAELTTFGLGSTRYLVAAIAEENGYCSHCLAAQFIVVDSASRAVVWRLAVEGAIRDQYPALRLFHVFPDDPTMTLALTYDSAGDREWRVIVIHQCWIRPRSSPAGLTFRTVWEGDVATDSWAASSWTFGRSCTDFISLWPKRAYRAVHHVEAGWMAADQPSSPVKHPCGGEESTFGAVVFSRTHILDEERGTRDFTPRLPAPWTKRVLRPTRTFPFNLPARRVALDLPLPASAGDNHGSISSPSGEFVCERAAVRGFLGSGFAVRRRSGEQRLRTVPDPSWEGIGEATRYGGYQIAAIGWTPDSQRILVVIDTGLLDLPPVLVSLTPTPDGRGDRWEGLLPEGGPVPSDGFVFDPAASN